MTKRRRIFFGAFVFVLALTAVPLSQVSRLRSSAYNHLEAPLSFSQYFAQFLQDLFHFKSNADELRKLKKVQNAQRPGDIQVREIVLENERLTGLLGLKKILPGPAGQAIYARVVGRSPSVWNRVFLIDKGAEDGLHVNRPVVAGAALIGRIIETGPSVSKVLLLTDPNSRIGVLVQRTRQQGILYGTSTGECRIKYLSADPPLKKGDIVESAGFGGSIPKGLLVGQVVRAWKEPGQGYQVAELKPATDLSRVEEVGCLV